MASPISPVALPALLHRPVLPTRQAIADDGDARSTESRRVAPRPGMLGTALSMQDDLSAAVSSLRGRRSEERQTTATDTAWVDHVLDEQVHDKVASLKQALLAGLRGAADLLAMLRGLFPDPSDALAVMRLLLDEDSLQELRAQLQEALDSLLLQQQQNGTTQAARAGLNSALKAKLRARLSGLPAADLRELYRDFVGSSHSPVDQYALWIDICGFTQRVSVLDFIEQALAADIYSLDPSCSRLEFGNLLSTIRRLATLRSADAQLTRDCIPPALMQQMQADPEQLLRGMLDLLRQRGQWPEVFAGPLAGMRMALRVEQKAQLVQALRRTLRALPHSVWNDAADQLQAQDALEQMVQQAMASERRHTPRNLEIFA